VDGLTKTVQTSARIAGLRAEICVGDLHIRSRNADNCTVWHTDRGSELMCHCKSPSTVHGSCSLTDIVLAELANTTLYLLKYKTRGFPKSSSKKQGCRLTIMHRVKHVLVGICLKTEDCEGESCHRRVNNGLCHYVSRVDASRVSKSVLLGVCNMRLLTMVTHYVCCRKAHIHNKSIQQVQ
jgi:hypothetical protein